ncbi:PAQR family membrane homeostasis protein TrhA [Sulfitobacter geojensis]|uniref:Hemolysin III family protein n=1 Tax=Sulfitobacter geojensis TaxID=1342299 RepID=A0AAE2VXM5_9RHOB|nr:hemolysin III family protein [Sulfitobacter geojensis]MBM1689079.1 hemolysin III family protein [Sulfitobacter geojensis]MBM1693146.1 hemolysin III family protein [Sulfitobacter geojensis]MBM1705312.1 hemolysin III family protein [Sulfitobacter geojensis]MBM1709370.1 hemolysin III family protein [Sulfitobacter geojensis]MBM1713435.1 hemolysin III family protein [Sulfitobacter geojensis]
MAYPYSKPETLADGAVHAAGLLLAIPACMVLMGRAAEKSSAELTATALYAACLILGFGASALYHMCPLDRMRPMLHRIDHAAIYLKIAGSYTPIVVVIGSSFAYGVLGLVWALAALGAIAKLSFWPTDAKGSLALYLLMGWLSALLIWPMWQHLDGMVVALVVIGGLTYSAGTRVYAHPGMPYQNAIWHSFVLVASTCLFGAIAISICSMGV